MTDSPAMMLWTDAYLGDTSHLTTIEHGAYLLILMAMWRAGGSLPNDDVRLSRTARLPLDKWRRMAPTILDFMTIEGASITQKRLKLELEIQISLSEKRKQAGHIGGRAKALKSLQPKPSNATVLPVANIKQTPSLPEPEPIPERKKEDSCPKQVRTRVEYPDDFEAFWSAYPTDANMSKKETLKEWERLSPSDRLDATASCTSFRAYCASSPDYRPVHACRYLSQRRFEGHAKTAKKTTAQVFVRIGSDPWKSWERFYLAEHGKRPPVNKEGTGWWFPAETPSEGVAA